MRLSDDTCAQARALIASRLGLDFAEGRRADLERGLVRACRAAAVSVPEEYVHWLGSLPEQNPEWRRLASHLTVGETYFFRDPCSFAALEQQVLPALIAQRRADGVLRLRLWSAGCATGEEPYSLAILLDRLLPDRADWALTILATDISREALEVAREGCYRQWSLRGTPTTVRDRYFSSRDGQSFELDPSLRRLITFAPLNLAEASYPSAVTSAIDVILCRNVLMYFTPAAQRAAVVRLRHALVPGGWLLVSPAETSSELLQPLVPINFPGAILYRNESLPIENSFFCHSDPAEESHAAVWPGRDMGIPRCAQNDTPVLERAPVDHSAVDSVSALRARRPAAPLASLPDGVTVPGGESFETASHPAGVTLIDEAPSDAEDLAHARALADQGQLERARRLCQAALARDRLNPETYLLLAAICQEQSEVPAALQALRRALYLAPHSAAAHFLLGSLLLQRGEGRHARRSMQNVVHLLSQVPRDQPVPDGDGFTAGRLREAAQAYLELQ